MEKLSFLLAISFMFVSCDNSDQDKVDLRTRVVSDQSIIVLPDILDEETAQLYQEGDTIFIKKFGDLKDPWKINNDGTRVSDQEGFTDFWRGSDSTLHGGSYYNYKTVVIEKIMRPEKK
ncbi:MAG: hypothetical protein H6766_00165 [Candidatus Peribacteria bacterium]|nr:MAG: hypothetical protein H6766_00165 [Candidatus Peribacteria bacterium]